MTTGHLLRGLNISAVALMALLVSGCASVRTADADVRSFAGQPAATEGATYRFEELPSHGNQPQQAQLQAMAERALAAAGLQRSDTDARYSVEVSLRREQFLRQPPLVMTRRGRLLLPLDGTLWVPVGPWGPDSTAYRYELRLVMRDTATARVSYETSAELEAPWSDTINVAPALLKAALSDYPKPPVGSRKISMELGSARPAER